MNEETARKRFMALNLCRLIGLLLVFGGIANIGGHMLPDLAPILGYCLVIAGAVDFFVSPVLLKKLWRDQDAQ